MSSDSPTTTTFEIPETMKRLVVQTPADEIKNCKLAVETSVPVPKPGPNQLLVKVVAAAVNPSDYGTWIRLAPEKCPHNMGKEGCGIVVDKGNGWLAYTTKIGSKVGLVGLQQKQGTYSEYVVIDAFSTFSLPQDLPCEDGAAFFVNPYTAIAILDTIKAHYRSGETPAFIHTAAASQLGQMLVKLAPQEGVKVINVVRRAEQAEALRELGAEHVIVSSGNDETWKESLKQTAKELNCKVAMDAVAGRSTGDVLDCLPNGGIVYVYGGLAGKVENIDPMSLIYLRKQVKGFILTNWVQGGGMVRTIPRMLAASKKVNAGLAEGWSSSKFTDTTMDTMQQDLVRLLESGSTGQKLRLRLDK